MFIKKVSPKEKGEITEQIVITEFMKKGYTILRPIGDNKRYDIVIENNNIFQRIQIKTGFFINGCVKFNTSSNRSNTKKNTSTPYTNNDIELFAVYCYETNKVYILPIDESNKYHIQLRVNATKNGKNYKTKFAKEYEL